MGAFIPVGAASLALLAACVGDDPILEGTSAPPGDDAGPGVVADSATTPSVDDAGGGTDAADAGARFCDTQQGELGVADFFCADFDGPELDAGFTTTYVPDGGALNRVDDVFFSPPASMTTTGSAFLQWEKSGAQVVSEIDVRVRMNVGTLGGTPPPETGDVTFIDLGTVDTHIRFNYTRGGNVEGTAYTGYYLFMSTCPSACGTTEKKVPTAPTANLWTDIRLVWSKNGAVELSYNDVSVLTTTSFSSTGTKASVQLGAYRAPDAPMVPRHAYDNVMVRVRREP